MVIPESYSSQIVTQAASLSILPFWYPPFAKSIYQRSQIRESQFPGDLSHSNFFKNKSNYYRGFTANLSMQPLYPLTDWILGTLLEKIKQANYRDPNLAEKLSAGFITGATTVLIANPYEVTIIASQNYRQKPYNVFKQIFKISGVKGLYTGAIPMAFRNGTFASSLLVTTPTLQRKLDYHIPGSGKAHDIATMVLAATIPASMYICVAAPLDLMVIMRQSEPSGIIYRSAFEAFNVACHQHGMAAFKTGLGNRLIACIIEMAGFNLFRNFYSDKIKKSSNV